MILPEDFVRSVQKECSLTHRGEALRTIRITLEVLGEQLAPDEKEAIINELPPRIGVFLRHGRPLEEQEPCVGDYWKYITDREGLQFDLAARQAVSVLGVLAAGSPEAAGNPGVSSLKNQFTLLCGKTVV